jgi:hypothetical protein
MTGNRGLSGYAVVKLFEALYYKPGPIPDEVIGFFNWTEVDLASDRNEYQEPSLAIKGGPRIKASYPGNVGASTSHKPMVLQGLLQG